MQRNMLGLMKKEIDSLECYPQRFAIIDDDIIKDLNVRRLIVKNYMVFYRINEEKKTVNVDRIIYSASDWTNKILP